MALSFDRKWVALQQVSELLKDMTEKARMRCEPHADELAVLLVELTCREQLAWLEAEEIRKRECAVREGRQG